MLTPYRKLFATPGGLAFSIPGSIARLPIAMTFLSVTFVVLHETNSYTLAGAVSTGAALTNAAFLRSGREKLISLAKLRCYVLQFLHTSFSAYFLSTQSLTTSPQ